MQPFFDNDHLVNEIVSCARAAIRGAPCWEVLDERVDRTISLGIDLPILWLRTRQGLSTGEQRVIWILLAHELDLESRLAIRDSLSEQLSDVPFDALRRFVYAADARLNAWNEIGPTGRLRTLGYVQRTDGTIDGPEHRQTFKVARRVLALAHGESALDPDASAYATHDSACAPMDRLIVTGDITAKLSEVANRGGSRLVVVHGRKGLGRRSLLTGIANGLGHRVLTVDASKVSTEYARASFEIAAIYRECTLLSAVPLVTNIEALQARDSIPNRLDLLDKLAGGLVFATSITSMKQTLKCAVHQFQMLPLSRRDTALMWRSVLPQASISDGEALSNTYPLAPAVIHAVGKAAVEEAGLNKMCPEHIQSAIRSVLDDRLGGQARRLEVQQSWEDLVLPDEPHNAALEFIARIRQRSTVYEEWGFAQKVGKGLGIAALFSGPPGTGKTMTASLIAAAVGLEVFQVDTSKITSKWIGETEKNLAALFDAAEAGHAVLLFDEADSLFGKRSDVKSSNDRHANQEVNFLLQRLESFSGICILTTNHEAALDEAFRRRIAIHVKFSIPDEDEREQLWRAMLPKAAPVEPNIDFTGLARRFAMTGGYIRNAALRAAFLAADEGTPIGSVHLEHAARLEYEGMGKIVTPPSTWPSRLSSAL